MEEPVRSRGTWLYLWAAAIALGGAGSLIVQWLRTRPLWLDEEMIALNVRDRSLAELTGPLWLNQSAPLGWLALQRAILVEFGTAERALRALPVLFGIATVVLAFWVGRRWMGPLGAALFVALVSFAPFISYFPLEIKQYSADACFGLLLPALALWAIEPNAPHGGPRRRRILLWWLTVAVAQWFSLGALLIAPACALVVCGVTLRREGWRPALSAMLPGFLLLASFGVHYHLSIRHALQSEGLQDYWWWAYPPKGSGFATRLRWLAQRIEPLARNPGGTHLWVVFWLTAACGIVMAQRKHRAQGLMLLAVPLTAFVFSGVGLVPLAERLALWMLPSLYAAVAMAAGGGAGIVRRSLSQRNWSGALIGALAAASALLACADIVHSGVYELSIQPFSKHNLDDRSAMRYLMATRQPGDALITTHMGLPAVWWYGGVSVAGPNIGMAFAEDGGPVLEARHRSGVDCRVENLPSTLRGRNRVLVYLGFASQVPAGFQELVLDTLSQRGKIVAYRRVAEEGVAAVFDLTQEPGPWTVVITRPGGTLLKDVARPGGCVGFFPVRRW